MRLKTSCKVLPSCTMILREHIPLLPLRVQNPDCYKMHSFIVSKPPKVVSKSSKSSFLFFIFVSALQNNPKSYIWIWLREQVSSSLNDASRGK